MIKNFSVTGKWIVSLIFFTFGFSQWAGYDVHQEEYSSTDLRIFIEGKTFGLSANPSLIISPENRAYVGIGLSKNTLLRPNTYQKQLSGSTVFLCILSKYLKKSPARFARRVLFAFPLYFY